MLSYYPPQVTGYACSCALGSDRAGGWMAGWITEGSTCEVVALGSADGISWSPLLQMPPVPPAVLVETVDGGAGTWIFTAPVYQDGLGCRSVDGGNSWTTASLPGGRGRVCTDHHGHWVRATGNTCAASVDDGVSWTGCTVDSCVVTGLTDVATNESGLFVTAYAGYSLSDPQRKLLRLLRSTDNGSSWSQPLEIAASATAAFSSPRLACNISSGLWVLTYVSIEPSPGTSRVMLSQSTDAIAWSTPVSVFTFPQTTDPFMSYETVADSDQHGTWMLCVVGPGSVYPRWSVASEPAMSWGTFASISSTPPPTYTRSITPELRSDAHGRWVAAWLMRGNLAGSASTLPYSAWIDIPLSGIESWEAY
jgi:hypothetical protein